MIIVIGSVTARPDSFEELRQASLDHVHRSRTEAGCISHSVQVDCEDPMRLFFFERWSDMAALKEHFGQPGSTAFIAAARRLAAASENISIYEASPAG
ncbi:MAG: antibiotic biosynthesis monooxygenase [Sphingomonas bacterium]|uniref:putative quinol monooxygenase n=1 Tax=Sphingomonas bacterium TaxID=1895847 RepID=UPI002639D0CD|nr:putative quinol monooxygenase [Sphingomonas bacterium]MDB5704849.1 antibiotic biosynthesis monooxygenase [Sphingomonas bacterium]